jgi:hypothetical protein
MVKIGSFYHLTHKIGEISRIWYKLTDDCVFTEQLVEVVEKAVVEGCFLYVILAQKPVHLNTKEG